MNSAPEKWVYPAIAKYVTVVVVAALCGSAAAILNDFYLSPHWSDLGWRRPVADWLIANGFGDTIAAYWGLVWLHLPEWLIAIFLGGCTGLCFRNEWIIGVVPCAFAFVFGTDIFLLFAGEASPRFMIGPDVSFRVLLWSFPSAILVFLAAYFSSRLGSSEKDGFRNAESR